MADLAIHIVRRLSQETSSVSDRARLGLRLGLLRGGSGVPEAIQRGPPSPTSSSTTLVSSGEMVVCSIRAVSNSPATPNTEVC